MNRTLQLQQDKNAAIEAALAITALATKESRKMSEDEIANFDKFETEAESITQTIAREERATAMTNAHADTKQTGTTVHENILDKPWGPEARSNESAKEAKARKEMGHGEFLKAVKSAALLQQRGSKGDPRLYALNEGYEKRAAASGSSESVPSDGGFLITPDFANEILELAHDTGLAYTRTRKLPLSEFTNAVKIPAVDEQSRKDGFRWGGVQMFWENEAQQLIGSKPTVALLELVTKKLTGLYYATDEVLNDTRLLGAIVLRAFGEEMGFKLDDGVIRGTGAGQLQGILNTPALITVAKENAQPAQTIVYENIKKMWTRLWNRSRRNAVWFINQDTEQALMSMFVANTTVPAFVPPGYGAFGFAGAAPMVGNDDASGGISGYLFGKPVIALEQCATLGTAGDIILADMDQYLMIDKGPMQTATSMHVRFLTDEMTFRWIYRTDGQSWWKTSLSPAQGTTTQSPFIVLAAR